MKISRDWMRSAVVLLALAMADDLSQLSAEDLPVFLRKEIGEKVADVIKGEYYFKKTSSA